MKKFASARTWREDTYNFYDPRHFGRYLKINAILALIISFFLCSDCFDSLEGLRSFFIDYYLFSCSISLTLSFGVNRIIVYSDSRFSWLEMPLKRLSFDLFAVGFFSFTTACIFQIIFGLFIWQNISISNLPRFWDVLLSSAILPTVISLAITLFFTSRSFFLEWRQAAVEAEQMRSERLAGQYQSLKDQLNPHFLFNSLNVLSNLVHENPAEANVFIEKLSRVYRYVLEVQNEELVDIHRELSFARSFLELQKIRFGDKLQFVLPEGDELAGKLPPLSLQLLLENAIKHNSATREKPLKIDVIVSGDIISVWNTLNPLLERENSTGIGLNNIKERYRFLTNDEVFIECTNDFFRVSLPIIKSVEA